MSLTHMQIKELLDEGRRHTCDGYGRHRVCVKIAAIALANKVVRIAWAMMARNESYRASKPVAA